MPSSASEASRLARRLQSATKATLHVATKGKDPEAKLKEHIYAMEQSLKDFKNTTKQVLKDREKDVKGGKKPVKRRTSGRRKPRPSAAGGQQGQGQEMSLEDEMEMLKRYQSEMSGGGMGAAGGGMSQYGGAGGGMSQYGGGDDMLDDAYLADPPAQRSVVPPPSKKFLGLF